MNRIGTLLASAGLGLLALSAPAAVFTVSNGNDTGPGSLRQAILDANATTGANVIQFSLPGSGVRSIAPLTAFPDITRSVMIDGYSQTGSSPNTLSNGNNGRLAIRLDGVNLTNGFPIGLRLNGASNCTVRGLILVRFYTGIQLNAASGCTSAGNWIGLDADGVSRGGTGTGVEVTCAVFNRSTGNVIGGTAPGDRNVIAGNHTGISFFPTSADHNSVLGNFIGTDATGTLPRGNLFDGISVQSATNITIGGTIPGAGNLIAANGTGIALLGSAGDVIRGNFIGTDLTAHYALGNIGDAIDVQGCNAVTIGGGGGGNFMANNAGHGLFILGTTNTIVQGNWIGTDAGAVWPMGNGKAGIYLQGSGINTIGGASPGAPNVIEFNTGAGVSVFSGDRTAISANAIYDNGGLGIDLGADGVTANDPGDADAGANQFQNYPVITSAVAADAATQISGTLNSQAGTTYRLEFFASAPRYSAGVGEGQVYLGTTNITTDNGGNANFSVALPTATPTGAVITGTATDPWGNTSEYSAASTPTFGPLGASLAYGKAGTNWTVTWPSAALGFTLESANSLYPPIAWLPVTNGISDDGTTRQYVVSVPGGAAQRFFRLRR